MEARYWCRVTVVYLLSGWGWTTLLLDLVFCDRLLPSIYTLTLVAIEHGRHTDSYLFVFPSFSTCNVLILWFYFFLFFTGSATQFPLISLTSSHAAQASLHQTCGGGNADWHGKYWIGCDFFTRITTGFGWPQGIRGVRTSEQYSNTNTGG